MKKTTKIAVIVCTLALVLAMTFALTACGGTKTYTYSKTTCSVPIVGAMIESTFNTMFADSTITVSDEEIVWKVGEEEEKIDVTKDGDKYVLSGDFAQEMQSILTEIGASGSVSMYGKKVSDGFQITMSMTIAATNAEIIIAFAK